MGSMLNGWWSWLVATFAALLLFVAVASLIDEDDVGGFLILGALAAVVVVALVIRARAPRAAAWLLVVGVGFPGIGFFWMLLIPTVLALVILVGGVKTGEISFVSRAEPSPELS